MAKVSFYSGQQLPLEMHKVRIIQKLTLLPIEERGRAIAAAGYNTFLLQNADVFLDMLTDSGVNAMSDQQQAAMLIADDAYAGSATYTRLYNKLVEIFGMDRFLIQMAIGVLDHGKLMKAIEILGDKVAPAVRKALPATAATGPIR